eukprot:COSAG02_NODE_1055_length_14928_cov_67.022726_1_plen_57_part_10
MLVFSGALLQQIGMLTLYGDVGVWCGAIGFGIILVGAIGLTFTLYHFPGWYGKDYYC